MGVPSRGRGQIWHLRGSQTGRAADFGMARDGHIDRFSEQQGFGICDLRWRFRRCGVAYALSDGGPEDPTGFRTGL